MTFGPKTAAQSGETIIACDACAERKPIREFVGGGFVATRCRPCRSWNDSRLDLLGVLPGDVPRPHLERGCAPMTRRAFGPPPYCLWTLGAFYVFYSLVIVVAAALR